MSVDYTGTHLNSAAALYRQRMGWLQTDRIDMQSMLELEYRLRVHLHVLSCCIDENDPEPGEAPDTFLYLASRFSQRDVEIVKQAAELACEWLLEESPRAQGAHDALLLFPSPTSYAQMQQTYVDVESLRPVIIYILTQHGARLPKGLTHQAELQTQDPFLQAQTLYYAANDINSDLAMFKSYYTPLVANHEMGEVEHGALVAAIWGGLVRGDQDANIALQRAIEHESDDVQRLDFLRFAALSGKSDYYPILQKIVDKVPEVGFRFLALHGETRSVETILEGLKHPRTTNYAEQAWWWVSGQTLPKKPRLSVVGKNNDDGLEEEVGYVPDALAADQWWSKQTRDQSVRWLQGKSFSVSTVQTMLKKQTGLISNDLFDLHALIMHTPVQLGNYTWHDVRLRKISQLNKATSAPLVDVNQEVRSA